MKKRVCFIFISIFLFLSALIFLSKTLVFTFDGNKYFNKRDASFYEKVANLTSEYKIKLILDKDGNSVDVNIKDLGIEVGFLNKEFEDISKIPISFNLNEVLLYKMSDEFTFNQYLKDLNKSLEESKDAYVKKTKKDIVVYDEVYGKQIDIENATKSIDKENVSEIIDVSDYVIQPKVLKSDFSSLERKRDKYKHWGIKYKNGFKLGYSDLFKYLKVKDNSIKFSSEKFKDYLIQELNENLASFNTVGKERTFKTTSGKEIKLSTGTYGDIIDVDAEVEYIMSSLKDFKSEEDRLPCYTLDLPDKIGDTYVEVSIEKQHLWYYIDGKLKMESSVVTGTKGKHDTPRGIYYISEKIPGKYLVGTGYRTWVNRWMRLTNTGIGLHDATWRGNFGGSIYTYSGSHGCINLPSSFAYKLFDAVERKTVVIIY